MAFALLFPIGAAYAQGGEFSETSLPGRHLRLPRNNHRRCHQPSRASVIVVQKNLAASKKQNKSTRVYVQ
jgi:hypothetical protein